MQGGRQPGGTEVPMAQPDARARARAADYVSVYLRWEQLGPEGRREEIRNIINAQLAREGIPPVRVTFTGREVGAAVFTAATWTMALSPSRRPGRPAGSSPEPRRTHPSGSLRPP
jgi:hypothetical protein